MKLLTRSQKIAFNLLHKIHLHGNAGSNSRENLLKPGDRVWPSILSNNVIRFDFHLQVALVYSSNDPINFICAFYGCLLAGIVPLPIDVPLARRVSRIRYTRSKNIFIRIRIGFHNALEFSLVNYRSKLHWHLILVIDNYRKFRHIIPIHHRQIYTRLSPSKDGQI